jgi:hypothetical protein
MRRQALVLGEPPCDVLDGWWMMVLVSPRLAVIEQMRVADSRRRCGALARRRRR